MTPVWAHPATSPGLYEAICEFVAVRIWGKVKPFPHGTAMAVADGQTIIAGLVFSNYDPDAGVIEVSGASDKANWLNRAVLKEMFGYAFDQLGCQAVVMRVDPDNRRLNRILTAYGFTRHDVPRLRGRDKAEAFYILGDDSWRANGFHKEN